MKNEFLIFKLGKEEYGVDIQKIQEIRNYESPTLIADQPNYVKGVINLRGIIVPILDLRIKFGLEHTYTNFTIVIVLNLNEKITGVVVDSVCDVITLMENQIQKVKDSDNLTNMDYIEGLGTLEDRMIQVINIEKFLNNVKVLEEGRI